MTRQGVVEFTCDEVERLAANGLVTAPLPDVAELVLDVATKEQLLPFFTCLA